MFVWSPERIRFLADASEYTSFNSILAGHIVPYLPNSAHVCDAGCGLGYLSLALSANCSRITAADTSAEALAVLEENLRQFHITNVDVCQWDVLNLPDGVTFDGMVFCFFGSVAEILRCAKTHCLGKAFLFKKNWDTHRFSLEKKPLERFTYKQTCAELDALGIPYESRSFSLEMGQPFRSLEDAAAFFRLNSPDGGLQSCDPGQIRQRLTTTNSAEFPYYLPANRPVGMIVLDAGDIPLSAVSG